jgi:hypothetical protein
MEMVYYKPHSYSGNYYFCTLKNKPKWPKKLCIEFNVSKGAFRISKLMNDDERITHQYFLVKLFQMIHQNHI